MKRSSNRQTYVVIGLIALIVFLLIIIDVSAVFDLLGSVDWQLMGAGMVLLILGYGVLTLRWRYLLGNEHGYRDLLKVTGSGYMMAILIQLPTSVYRVLVMEQKSMAEVPETSSAIAVEVVLNIILRIISAILLISLLVARSRETADILMTSLIVVGGLLLLVFLVIGLRERLEPCVANLLARLPKVDEDRAKHTSASIFHAAAVAGSPKRFGIALLLSLSFWLCGVGFYLLAAAAFPINERFKVLAIAVTAMTVVPISTPMMIGVFHGLLIAALVALKLASTTEATSYAIVVHLIQMVVLLILGSWGLRHLKLKPREIIQNVRDRKKRGDVEAVS